VSRARVFDDHLAMYVAPLEPQNPDEYAAAIAPLTQVFLPAIFDMWPGLASFDICQEPPWEGNYENPPPLVTVIDVTRAQVEAIDWDALDLSGLIEGARAELGFRLAVNEEVGASDEWLNAGGGHDLVETESAHDIDRYDTTGDIVDG
jgi:hypothetical protein